MVRGRPLDIQGGLGRSGDEKLFISRQSDAKIFFSHSRDAKIFLPTFCVTEDIHGAWVQIFFSPLLRRNLFISKFFLSPLPWISNGRPLKGKEFYNLGPGTPNALSARMDFLINGATSWVSPLVAARVLWAYRTSLWLDSFRYYDGAVHLNTWTQAHLKVNPRLMGRKPVKLFVCLTWALHVYLDWWYILFQ